ncbi:hypothetical protein [Chryseobacterium daeguense]|uniref:hypothetical protein n=1 Tax=Chryseobacterium daeguense TaxID=412438 RepID=UPI0003F5AF3D|nr:hypothetical protein [Chryseobacterium daeguense]
MRSKLPYYGGRRKFVRIFDGCFFSSFISLAPIETVTPQQELAKAAARGVKVDSGIKLQIIY